MKLPNVERMCAQLDESMYSHPYGYSSCSSIENLNKNQWLEVLSTWMSDRLCEV